MNQPDHVTSVIAITVRKVIQKLITYTDFQYEIDVKKRTKNFLVPEIHFSYQFFNNLT